MRRLVVASLLALTASSAFAFEQLRFNPTSARIRVGETVYLRAFVAHVSGFSLPPNWGRIWIVSQAPDVATALGVLEYPRGGTDVEIVGISPGVVDITGSGSGIVGMTSASIEVYCDEATLTRTERVSAKIHTPLTLSILPQPRPGRVITWYAGALDDTSHPLATGVSQLKFTPMTYGTTHIWARAVSACGSDTTEFAIDVPLPRRRAVR
jgi:hypothetical protein